jgi:hypothetical protein
MRSHQLLIVAIVLLFALASGAAFTGTLSFLKDAPIAEFKERDIEMMKSAANALLQDGEEGSAREWKNSETGNSGRLEISADFETPDGRRCKRLLVINRAKTVQSQATYSLCRDAEGNWTLDEQAKPRNQNTDKEGRKATA